MVDRNLQNFYGRLGRIERIHAAGGGFEAEGTLGMSHYPRSDPRVRRFGLMGSLALVLMAVIAIKAAVLATIGAVGYQDRIIRLQAGSTADHLGAYLLQADPLTVALAAQVRKILP